MAPSVHDNLLVSYEVQCEKQIITLRTEFRLENRPTEFTNVVFAGVLAYRFENDAFGNIIFDVCDIPLERFLAEHGGQISELYRMTGSPGKWAECIDAASAYLDSHRIQAFVLSSSLGLSGWVLAREMSITGIDCPSHSA
jgi:hypothetical protein